MPITKFLPLAIVLIAFASCRKTPLVKPPGQPVETPAMTYFDLSGKSVKFGQTLSIDLNGDGRRDVWFETEQVADNLNNLLKDCYVARTYLYCNLLINDNLDDWEGESQPLDKGSEVTVGNAAGKLWLNLASVNIMRKMTQTETNSVHWESKWINRGHLYLGLQFFQNKKWHTGWIELEADSGAEKLTFYKAAVSVEPEKPVKAGW